MQVEEKKAIIEKIKDPNNQYLEDKIFSDLDAIKDILKFENGNIRFQLRIPELVKINNLPFVKKNYKKNGSVYE